MYISHCLSFSLSPLDGLRKEVPSNDQAWSGPKSRWRSAGSSSSWVRLCQCYIFLVQAGIQDVKEGPRNIKNRVRNVEARFWYLNWSKSLKLFSTNRLITFLVIEAWLRATVWSLKPHTHTWYFKLNDGTNMNSKSFFVLFIIISHSLTLYGFRFSNWNSAAYLNWISRPNLDTTKRSPLIRAISKSSVRHGPAPFDHRICIPPLDDGARKLF